MEKLEATLSAWEAIEPRTVRGASIKTDEALQPRSERLVAFRDRSRQDEASQEHVARLTGVLAAGGNSELEPLLVADVAGTLYVVDGHHRLKAYKRAKRQEVPARVLAMPMKSAVLLSKLVNLGGVKLPMHKEQARDALWQYLAHVTARGKLPLPAGESTRTVAGRFGTSPDTVWRMQHALPKVILGEFSEDSRDAGTGWPRWKYVRGNSQRAMADAFPPDQRTQWQAERCAKQLARLAEKVGEEVFALAVELLRRESAEGELRESLGALRELSATD